MKIYRHDIAIIGGGPSGSTTASYLADAGFDVCILEKKNFPRNLLCGEFLSGEVIRNLKSIGLFEKFISLKPNPILSFRLINSNGLEIHSPLEFPAYSLKRSDFDLLLLQEAAAKGTVIYQPAVVAGISLLNSEFRLKVKKTGEKEICIIAKKVIGAYGRQNRMDKVLRRDFTSFKSGLNGIKFHLDKKLIKNLPVSEIQIYADENIYCGINMVNDDKVTLCYLEKQNGITKSPWQTIKELRKRNSCFSEIFTDDLKSEILRASRYGTGNIYFGKRELVKNGVFMIGDAAGVIAPFTGDGIGMAMDSARILSNILISEREGRHPESESAEIYIKLWSNNFQRRLRLASIVQNIILRNSLRNPALNTVKIFPPLLKYMIKATRH